MPKFESMKYYWGTCPLGLLIYIVYIPKKFLFFFFSTNFVLYYYFTQLKNVFQVKTELEICKYLIVTFEFLPKYIHNNLAKTIHVLPSEISVTYCRFSSTSVTYCRNSTFAAIGGLRKYVYREAKARRPYLQVACSFHAYAVYPTVRNGINQYIE